MHGDRRPGGAAYPASADATVHADFESGTFSGWTVEGRCFGDGFPVTGRVRGQSPTGGEEGLFFVNSSCEGDGATGKATSEPFPIGKRRDSASRIAPGSFMSWLSTHAVQPGAGPV